MKPYHYLLPGEMGPFIQNGRAINLRFALAHLDILHRVQQINVQYSTAITSAGWWGGQVGHWL